MKMPFFTSLFVALTCINLSAQNDLTPEAAAIQRTFDEKVEQEVKALRTLALDPLEKKYADALTRAVRASEATGNITEAKAFEAELNQQSALRADPSQVVPLSREDMPPSVFKMRGIYLAEVAKFEAETGKRIEAITSVHQRLLDELAAKMSREGRLMESKQAIGLRNRIAMARCKIAGARLAPFANGEKAFMNRDYVWTDIPTELTGLTFSLGAGNRAPPLVINVLRPGILYVSLNDETAEEGMAILKNLGFKKSRDSFKYNARGGTDMLLYSKFVVQPFTLKPATGSFTGFVVLGDLE